MKACIAIVLALICLVPVGILSGCHTKAAPASNMVQIKIGVAVYRQDDTFIASVRGYIEEAAKLRETQDNIKITVNTVDSKNNQSIQNDQVDKFVAQGYDVICVNEVDRTAASLIIDKARAANIPVVFFNREPVGEDMQRWDKLFYVGSDPKEAGAMQGKLVIDALRRQDSTLDYNQDGRLQYVILEGEPGHQDAAIRTEYCIKTVINQGIVVEKLANDTANWQRGEASSKMAQWIDRYGEDIEVVFCNNDDMALGAIDAYQAAEITRLPLIIGIDGTPPALEAIAAGNLAGTVRNDAKGQGYAIFSIAYALATGQNLQEAVPMLNGQYAWLPHKRITQENLEEERVR